jgi:hypothetical protein
MRIFADSIFTPFETISNGMVKFNANGIIQAVTQEAEEPGAHWAAWKRSLKNTAAGRPAPVLPDFYYPSRDQIQKRSSKLSANMPGYLIQETSGLVQFRWACTLKVRT